MIFNHVIFLFSYTCTVWLCKIMQQNWSKTYKAKYRCMRSSTPNEAFIFFGQLFYQLKSWYVWNLKHLWLLCFRSIYTTAHTRNMREKNHAEVKWLSICTNTNYGGTLKKKNNAKTTQKKIQNFDVNRLSPSIGDDFLKPIFFLQTLNTERIWNIYIYMLH